MGSNLEKEDNLEEKLMTQVVFGFVTPAFS